MSLSCPFQMAAYAAELQQLHTAFSHVDAGLTSGGGAEVESFLRNAEDLVDELQENTELLAGDGGWLSPLNNSAMKNKNPYNMLRDTLSGNTVTVVSVNTAKEEKVGEAKKAQRAE